jgi:hypothetical protein
VKIVSGGNEDQDYADDKLCHPNNYFNVGMMMQKEDKQNFNKS